MNLDGLGNTPATGWADKIGTVISNVAPTLVAARAQDKVLRLNIQREAAGLKPLDVESYKPGVKVGIDRQTLMIVAAIVVAVLAFLFFRGRK